ncbi:MAG TPA: hypothetical protein VJL29_10315, partial [Thermoguttaceae bacterium]|nr:hypothetical protein [Thermoguttaceae bacterium]
MSEKPSDDILFALLNDYLDRLHAGESIDRDRVVREHPELGSALECLHVLEGFVRDLPDEADFPPLLDDDPLADDLS